MNKENDISVLCDMTSLCYSNINNKHVVKDKGSYVESNQTPMKSLTSLSCYSPVSTIVDSPLQLRLPSLREVMLVMYLSVTMCW